MKKPKNLKEFCRNVLSLVGTGYNSYRINRIPQNKAQNSLKLSQILDKVKNQYMSDLNKDARYRNKKNGNANYQAIYYLENIYIFRTSGKRIEKQENGFLAHNDKIEFRLSENLELTIFRDERKKLTFRIGRTTYRAIKERIGQALNSRNGQIFHREIKKLGGLPTYRGIQMQKKDLAFYIHRRQKVLKTHFSMPKYI